MCFVDNNIITCTARAMDDSSSKKNQKYFKKGKPCYVNRTFKCKIICIYKFCLYISTQLGQCEEMTHLIELSEMYTFGVRHVHEGAPRLIYDGGYRSKNAIADCTQNSINYTEQAERTGAQCV